MLDLHTTVTRAQLYGCTYSSIDEHEEWLTDTDQRSEQVPSEEDSAAEDQK